jgi:NAD(P)-dependent dehydrogenase (short-subunit alcohol dehydrogenase family)
MLRSAFSAATAASVASRRLLAAVAADSPPPTFLIFGASGGVGAELARALLARPGGARVALAGRDDARLAELAAALGPGAAALPAGGVLDAADVERQVAEAAALLGGRLDGVASCVGSVLLKSLHATTPAEFDAILQTNLYSSFNVLRAAVKRLMRQEGGGAVALCSSAVAAHGLANHEAIAAAKGGLEAMARSAAATYASKGVRINCVAPGLTRTPMTARITGSEAALKASVAMHALGRIGEAGDVARALAFLLDPAQGHITGQTLAVDGGLSSLRPTG